MLEELNCTFMFLAADLLLNVPRFLRLLVFGFFFRENSRYSPDLSFRIIGLCLIQLITFVHIGHLTRFTTSSVILPLNR
jgi:hypothetical protein